MVMFVKKKFFYLFKFKNIRKNKSLRMVMVMKIKTNIFV